MDREEFISYNRLDLICDVFVNGSYNLRHGSSKNATHG